MVDRKHQLDIDGGPGRGFRNVGTPQRRRSEASRGAGRERGQPQQASIIRRSYRMPLSRHRRAHRLAAAMVAQGNGGQKAQASRLQNRRGRGRAGETLSADQFGLYDLDAEAGKSDVAVLARRQELDRRNAEIL